MHHFHCCYRALAWLQRMMMLEPAAVPLAIGGDGGWQRGAAASGRLEPAKRNIDPSHSVAGLTRGERPWCEMPAPRYGRRSEL